VTFKTAEIEKENLMKRMALVVSALVLVLSVAGWARNTAQPKSESSEQELIKLEKGWADAIRSGNAAFLERIYAADIVLTDEYGVVTTGAQDIASLKSGEVVYSSFVDDNYKVHVYGDAAVVIGRSIAKGKEKGKDFSHQTQWTDTWIKIAGRWQCVASHGSFITQK
jgi:ketosteroid isomerase-like protein